jgi:type I restriction enzyme M protein
MTTKDYDELFFEIKLPTDVKSRLDKVHTEPEGRVEALWVHRLIVTYLFHPEQIALQRPAGAGRNASASAVFADIVAYRDLKRKEPFVVVEVKKKNALQDKDKLQAESYARNLGAEYHVCSDWITSHFFKTAKYLDASTKVGNIPSWVEGAENKTYLGKNHVLPPFKDEEHLRKVVRKCHDRIFFNLGHDPAKSFDELMKVFFLKMYDERVTPKEYRFAILPGQSQAEVAKHISALFNHAAKSNRYADVFTTRFSKAGASVSLDLDEDTIFFIVEQLQNYSLINTTATLEGVDIKGTVFEQMVGATFRGELGAYFTPRELVGFCINMIDPEPTGRVLDPSCGSGGFLIMVIKQIKEKLLKANPNLDETEIALALKEYCDSNILGVDINERMVRVAKMNMIMHGDGHSGIYNSHGLNIGISDRLPIENESIAYVFSNPPFAGRESNPSYLASSECAKTDDGGTVSLHKTIPFVEMIINVLQEGGQAALVLPNSVFNSPSSTFKKLRQMIFEQTTILAVIGLPHWVFFHTGCDVQGSLLFIRKGKQTADDYNVFIDTADHVGYDAKGSKTNKNDLPEIQKRYSARTKANLIRFSVFKKNDRFDPLFYKNSAANRLFKHTTGTCLGDLCEPGGTIVSKSKTNRARYNYLEVGGADPDNGRIIELKEYRAFELPSRAKWIVRPGMVLLPNHRNSIAAHRSPVLIDEEHEGIIVTSRFIPLFCKVPPAFVFYLLKMKIVQEKMLTTVTGGSSTEIKWNIIKKIPVPVPTDKDYDSFLADVLALESKIERHQDQVTLLGKQLSDCFTKLFEK